MAPDKVGHSGRVLPECSTDASKARLQSCRKAVRGSTQQPCVGAMRKMHSTENPAEIYHSAEIISRANVYASAVSPDAV